MSTRDDAAGAAADVPVDAGAAAAGTSGSGTASRLGPLRLLQWPMILWLTVVWTALWGNLSVLVVLSGVLVGVGVCLVFPLPPLRLGLALRPWPALVLAARFLADIVVASLEVAWVTLRRRRPTSAVIEVDLASDSDFVMTVVAEIVSLIPGSVIVEARRSTHTLFLHVLDVDDDADAESARRRVLAQERRVLRAFSPDPVPAPRESRGSTTHEEGDA
ncbi:hypothetical protein GCM10009737_06270 [Nocardioides lentus]|uniref:Na+/H+ antiporter subunit E n=1 Tax=Nocardioides lentus TaxID=338077 RepID=A0ABP5ADC7_9ACTN